MQKARHVYAKGSQGHNLMDSSINYKNDEIEKIIYGCNVEWNNNQKYHVSRETFIENIKCTL